LRHVRQVDGYERELPGIVGELTRQGDTQGLMAAYGDHHNEQQKRASRYRSLCWWPRCC
jgi:hypothetical protein